MLSCISDKFVIKIHILFAQEAELYIHKNGEWDYSLH